MSETITKAITLEQPPEAVWQALTDSAALGEWLMPNDFEPRVGHRFTFRTEPNPKFNFDGIVHCEVRACAPPSELAYTWVGGGLDTLVTYRLIAADGGTRLELEQSGFDTSQPLMQQVMKYADYGWAGMLDQLAKVVAAVAPSR
ncbi:MAG: SRPBCC domain-containing protein [Candidatus Dormiibacterota bacterium]